MAINEITPLIPPPECPFEAGPFDRWDQIQESLGTSLPDDFRDFGLTYGTGYFPEQGLRVFNPFAAIYPVWFEEERDVWQSLRTGEGDEEVPFSVFPESPGILPWGSDEGGSGLFWLTEGAPENWPILVRSHETPKFYRFEMELTTFLSKVISGQIVVPNVFEDEDFSDPSQLVFQPQEIIPQTPSELMNIYELYHANGDRAGFWIMSRNWVGSGTEVLVRRVAGLSEGPLTTPTPNGESTPVMVDVFVDGKFFETIDSFPFPESRKFSTAEQPGWWPV